MPRRMPVRARAGAHMPRRTPVRARAGAHKPRTGVWNRASPPHRHQPSGTFLSDIWAPELETILLPPGLRHFVTLYITYITSFREPRALEVCSRC